MILSELWQTVQTDCIIRSPCPTDACESVVDSIVGTTTVNVGTNVSAGLVVGDSVGAIEACTAVGGGGSIVGSTTAMVGEDEQPAKTSTVTVVIHNDKNFGCITIYMFPKGMQLMLFFQGQLTLRLCQSSDQQQQSIRPWTHLPM